MISEENMPEDAIPQQIFVLTAPVRPDDADLQPRRGSPATRLSTLKSVDIVSLQGQVNVFLQQLDQVMSETPEKVGGFRLSEFEVSAGIVAQATGGVQIVLLA